ncbi:DNA polymerase iota-like [Eudromia elegans]
MHITSFSEEKQSCKREAGTPSFPFHVSPGDIDQEVFRELPEDIKKEIISEATGKRMPTENAFSQPSLCFPKERNSTSLSSQRVSNDTTTPGCSIHFTRARDSDSLLADSSSASCSSEYPGNTLLDADMEKKPKDPVNLRKRDLLALEAGASQTVLPVPGLGTDEQAFGTTSDPKAYGSREGIAFPLHVDPETFFELPETVQAELLAEWRNQDFTSKTFMDKHPEKSKTNRGRKSTASCLSQSNNLLRYFKPQ